MKKINHYVVEIIYNIVPDYITINSQSVLIFLIGEKTEEILPEFKNAIKNLSKKDSYNCGFKVNIYVLSPDGKHEFLKDDDKNLLKINKMFSEHFESGQN